MIATVAAPAAPRLRASAPPGAELLVRPVTRVQFARRAPVARASATKTVGQSKSDAAKKLAFAALAATQLTLAGIPAAYAFDASEAVLNKGDGVFTNNCATCHTGGQNVIESEKTLERDALVEYLDGGFNYDAIVTQVNNGKGSMPAWAQSLSEEDIKAVAAYVYTQAEKDLW